MVQKVSVAPSQSLLKQGSIEKRRGEVSAVFGFKEGEVLGPRDSALEDELSEEEQEELLELVPSEYHGFLHIFNPKVGGETCNGTGNTTTRSQVGSNSMDVSWNSRGSGANGSCLLYNRCSQRMILKNQQKYPSNSDLSLSPSTSSRQTRASTLAILPDVDPELLMRKTKRMRITSEAASSQPPLVDASRRALDTIKEKYQSGPSREAQSLLDDHVIEQYFDFEGGAGPSATGENLSPAKSVDSEHPTVVENENSPGKQPTGPPSEASDELVEVPEELGDIFHAPRKVTVNQELVKLLEDRKDSEIATLWASMTFPSVRLALKNEALDRFRETNAIKPTVKWFKNALDRLAQGWRLRNKNGAVVRLEGELCTDCQRRLDGGEDFRVGCIGPRYFKMFGADVERGVTTAYFGVVTLTRVLIY
ncbi:hypothetical protein TREMEDRAFT_59167 [Tremella mesenterica DSM 1558]|uniref:uncharacterized protein n=1 Tax=Tremella mesenterica (strain ATCC 24925 / CBS 8224 / DSM 1558 / NBRC 9311 / NRRL Y-6157 / RJB 2259-6 / UBC 559-6) TaxID=578456 RepID=UPI0003F49CA8|nr:uncharacterized protein TREMEDRAFT_59167 [Tremella mesenterica DSM 1558]EIW73007.1 hypothetical protein TREMEDRAFT_59167 [Tremella mesenterica DSM 1558]